MRVSPILIAAAVWLFAGPVAAAPARIEAIGVENEYADIIAQVGGNHVRVQAILSNPSADPHAFEASPKLARQIAAAQLIVANGLGYDAWAEKLIAASPRPGRTVITVQQLRGLPDDTANPHLWYDPKTMPAVARAVEETLARLDPAHAPDFHANADQFVASLGTWTAAIAAFKAKHDGTPIAVSEPVANYMLEAMGFDIRTPFTLQKAAMDGTDPAPQDITAQNELFDRRQVTVFAYNQQVTSSLTTSYLNRARTNGIPVVGVYETMPTLGYSYQSWMLAEVEALERAVGSKASTPTLQRKR